MKIYSKFRQDQQRHREGSERNVRLLIGAMLRRRGRLGIPWRKIKLLAGGSAIFCLCLVLFNLDRFSFAYNPPLNDTLLVRPGVLASFQSVSTTDPDDYEPDSMDRIDEVVEDVRPSVSLTRKEFKLTRYRVRPGDSVWDIAQKNGIRTATLLWANPTSITSSARLSVGHVIWVPNMDAIEVKLRAGESISFMARKFSVNQSEVMKFNAVADIRKIKAGDRIIIPNPQYPVQTESKKIAKITRKVRQVMEEFLWPAASRRITSEFGFRVHPVRHRRIFHEGLDIGGGYGAPAYAIADGSISFVGWMRGYGKIVVIRHKDGITSRYGHLASTKMFRGQRVEQGQIIGTIGATGMTTGPHLHLEIRKNGLPKDPIAFLRR